MTSTLPDAAQEPLDAIAAQHTDLAAIEAAIRDRLAEADQHELYAYVCDLADLGDSVKALQRTVFEAMKKRRRKQRKETA